MKKKLLPLLTMATAANTESVQWGWTKHRSECVTCRCSHYSRSPAEETEDRKVSKLLRHRADKEQTEPQAIWLQCPFCVGFVFFFF